MKHLNSQQDPGYGSANSDAAGLLGPADGTFSAASDPWASTSWQASSGSEASFGPGWAYGQNFDTANSSTSLSACYPTSSASADGPATLSPSAAGAAGNEATAIGLNQLPSAPPLAGGALSSVAAPIAFESTVGTGGSSALKADQLRSAFGLTGSGIKVGVLSDSFNNLGGYAADSSSGALPPGVVVLGDELDGKGSDEGRAMLELVHQIAPGAQLYFDTGEVSDQVFADNVSALRNAGCNII